MGFVGDRVALGQFSVPTCFGFPLSVVFHQMIASYIPLIYHQRHTFLATEGVVLCHMCMALFCSKIDETENRM